MIFYNVIDKSGKRTGGKIFSLVKKNDSLMEISYIYGADVVSLFSSKSLIPGKELASIQTVKQELAEIQRDSVRGYDTNGNEYDPDTYLVLTTFYLFEMGAIVCREGVYRWADDKEEFECIGKVDKVVERKTVTFSERTQIKIGEFSVQYEKSANFSLDGEYITYDSNGNPTKMLVLQNEFTNPIAIPYNGEFMVIGSRDLITIS
ncbi:hypothetical protein [Neobacillus muris]|uniref:hypothetical protein n=1 Tax=Neobacillus muris TaxID=2941334 RepID=UPI002042606B|nr:hypothetical protein [Neobacillus muris]